MKVALINTNRMKPPIAPIGLDYVAESLHSAGHTVHILDLCWENDPAAALSAFLDDCEFGLVGITLRNTDDCVYTSRESFLPGFIDLVKTVRAHSGTPIVLGGVGFSTMPERVLALSGADYGIRGDGEFSMPALAAMMEQKGDVSGLPNLVLQQNGQWRCNPLQSADLARLPAMRRVWVDNRRYFREGGQAGFETKRGCSASCIYCADPVAKGRQVRMRPPADAVDEIEALLSQGIDHLHTCDGEFNIDEEHAAQVCREIVRRGIHERIRWYAYCSPVPFTRELAGIMREAGCAGIDFGADNGSPEMLRRLGRNFAPEDIVRATRWTREAGMAVMLDLLLGAPGENRTSVAETVNLMKRADPDRVGVSLGVRVYPGTPLSGFFERGGTAAGLTGGEDPVEPVFFMEPDIREDVFNWIHDLIGDDERFLFYDPNRPRRNYNYNDNQRLVDAIREGYRGAYWDILRKLALGTPASRRQ